MIHHIMVKMHCFLKLKLMCMCAIKPAYKMNLRQSLHLATAGSNVHHNFSPQLLMIIIFRNGTFNFSENSVIYFTLFIYFYLLLYLVV